MVDLISQIINPLLKLLLVYCVSASFNMNYIFKEKNSLISLQIEDGRVGGCGICVSSQLQHECIGAILTEHLLGARVGDLKHLREWEESLHNQVGRGRERGGRKVEARWDRCPWMVLGRKRGSHIQRALLTARGLAGRERDSGGVAGIRAEHEKWLPPDCSGPSETARVLGLSPTPLRASSGAEWENSLRDQGPGQHSYPRGIITTMYGLEGVTLNAYHLLNIVFDFTEK